MGVAMSIQIYGFWRSIASFRVRVALRLKGLTFEETPIDILSGEQFQPGYEAVNDAERLCRDPATRWVVGHQAIASSAASASQMG